jgi:hypothetical protein
MSAAQEQKQKSKALDIGSEELDRIISEAIEKVGGKKENDLCRYIPVEKGGYMHHFTLRKMKSELPGELARLISKFIIEVDTPLTVKPKERAARGSRKRRDQIVLTKWDIKRMIEIARSAGDNEMIAKLTPKKSLSAIKRDLIAIIRQGKVDGDLWNSYVESIQAQSASSALNGTNSSMQGSPSTPSQGAYPFAPASEES